MSIYDDEILKALREEVETGRLRVVDDGIRIWQWIQDCLTGPGGSVDIYNAPGAIVEEIVDPANVSTEFAEFMMSHLEADSQPVDFVYCGDGLTELAYFVRLPIANFLEVVKEFPQHHFFVAASHTKLFCLTFENSMIYVKVVDAVH